MLAVSECTGKDFGRRKGNNKVCMGVSPRPSATVATVFTFYHAHRMVQELATTHQLLLRSL